MKKITGLRVRSAPTKEKSQPLFSVDELITLHYSFQ